MKGLAPLFLGIFGTFAFSWVGLTMIPNWQIGHLDPQMEEDGTDVYPQPQSGMVERGARVYAANGCIYCHSQQVRADYASDDIERKWGDRRSAPRDYIFERPTFLGKMRMGQDLSNIGARAGGTGKRSARRSCKSCSFACASGRRRRCTAATECCSVWRKANCSSKSRFATARRTSSQSNYIASASGFPSGSRRIASSAFRFASA